MPNAETNVESPKNQAPENTSANLYSSVQDFMKSDSFKSITEPLSSAVSSAMNHLPKLELDFGTDSQGAMKPNQKVPGGCTGFDGLPANGGHTPKASDKFNDTQSSEPQEKPPGINTPNKRSDLERQENDKSNRNGGNLGPESKQNPPDINKNPQPQQRTDKSLPPASPNNPSNTGDKGAHGEMKKKDQGPIKCY